MRGSGFDGEVERQRPLRLPGAAPSLDEQRQYVDAWLDGAKFGGLDVEFIPLYVVNHILGRS